MTETLTGKAALLAILDGTHWWVTGESRIRYHHGKNCFEYAGTWSLQTDENWILKQAWTRGKPVESEE